MFKITTRVGIVFVLAMLLGCETPSTNGSSVSASGSNAGGNGASGGSGGGGSGGEGGGNVMPMPPADLVHYVTGNDADADVTPTGPGLILMGGGTDVDAAFLWWKPRIAGGDVVVLRASGADGYNDYLYKMIGGCDSVETLLVTSKELANDPYVLSRVAQAEAIFMAGGDQANYANFWRGTQLVDAINTVWTRGGVVGGTSAGSAVLGEYYFAAYEGSVLSTEALQDPYNMYMTVDRDFFVFPQLAGLITDSHFATRDRMGRLVGFLGRIITDGWATSAKGIGIDEETAIVIDANGKGEILGAGKAYLVNANQAPAVCTAGQPLEYSGLLLHRIGPSDTLQFPSGTTSAPAEPLAASGGMLSIANPY